MGLDGFVELKRVDYLVGKGKDAVGQWGRCCGEELGGQGLDGAGGRRHCSSYSGAILTYKK